MAEPSEIIEAARRYLRQRLESGETEILLSRPVAEVLAASDPSSALEDLRETVGVCTRCPLAHNRTHAVFGEGDFGARVLFIGEAPGAEEDRQGRPFVGAAGQLLTRIITAIGFSREEVYITNILKCRPPNNRDPLPEEAEQCEPYLLQQIDLIRPKVICALGRIAAQTLLRTTAPISQLRGRLQWYHGIKLIATYHPAALLRYPKYKSATWDDVRLLRKEYDGLQLPKSGARDRAENRN